MKTKSYVDEEEYQKLVKKIEEESPYQRKKSAKNKWMTAPELGRLLGLKKTERYWLIHKNYFKSEELLGAIRIDIESFEKWYANQVKYHKVNGEPPGKERSYSVKDLSEMLDMSEWVIRDIIRQNNIETIVVDYWMRVPREAFWDWYKGQTRYRTLEDRARDAEDEAAFISMPQMARLLGITRQQVYTLLASPKYKDIFEIIIIADRKRITKESFQKFLSCQNKYQVDKKRELALELEMELKMGSLYPDSKREEPKEEEVKKFPKLEGKKFLSMQEAADFAGVSRALISKWYMENKFPVYKAGNRILIYQKEFREWLEKEQKGGKR